MKKLYTIDKYEEYCKIVNEFKLSTLKAETFGLKEVLPFTDKNNLKTLFDEYSQRDKWFESYLNTKVNSKKSINFIWGEAARVGNAQYIYHKNMSGDFEFQGKICPYFEYVSEFKFGTSVVIDFFFLFGISHTSHSRHFLNSLYKKNFKFYNEYLFKYIKSIFNILNIPFENLKDKIHIVAAPLETRDSILTFFKNGLNYNDEINCYKNNYNGLISDSGAELLNLEKIEEIKEKKALEKKEKKNAKK